ncbi:MAG: elongation factor P [Clostridiales bacterium]
MISSNDFRPGVTIEMDGDAFQVLEFQHVKPGKGAAFVRTKMKNVRTGSTVEKTFDAGEKVPKAHLDRRNMQYLYKDGEEYIFMDNETYEQIPVNDEQLGSGKNFLIENMDCSILFYKGDIMGIDLPGQVTLVVAETEPGIKGDTASGGSKPAILETGAKVNVPFFINEGDRLRINTTTGEYIERAKD